MNKIEPLNTLLKIYKDKNKTLLTYLPNQTIQQLTNCYFLDEEIETLYLDDTIFLIHKSTGLIEKKGKTIKITDKEITLRVQCKYNVNYCKDNYYIFKKRKRKNNKKEIYESLLNNL